MVKNNMKYYTFYGGYGGSGKFAIGQLCQSVKDVFLSLSDGDKWDIILGEDGVPLYYDEYQEVERWCIKPIRHISKSDSEFQNCQIERYYYTREEAIKAACTLTPCTLTPITNSLVGYDGFQVYPITVIELVRSYRGVVKG